tara:strand:+ start:230 stop:583 length:354 start_codon:yes stop_codon:yes gene_type:complete
MEYNMIKKFHMNPPDIQLLRRKDIEEEYQRKKQKSNNYDNDLKKRLFKEGESWVITKNKYPYHFIDKTKHEIMWFLGDVDWNFVHSLFKDKEVVYFENKQQNKSIKTIRHIHIFTPF